MPTEDNNEWLLIIIAEKIIGWLLFGLASLVVFVVYAPTACRKIYRWCKNKIKDWDDTLVGLLGICAIFTVIMLIIYFRNKWMN